jgi:hypothetical protein
MALLYIDAFPYANPRGATPYRWTSVQQGYVPGHTNVSTSGRFGGRWLDILADGLFGAGWGVFRNLGTNVSTLMIQHGLLPQVQNNGSAFLRVYDGGTVQLSVVNNNGTFSVYRGNVGTLLGTSGVVITSSVWHQIELKVTFHSSTGTVLLKVDGVTLIDLTDQNTIATANAYANGVQWFAAPQDQRFGISDIIVMDTTGDYCNDLLGSRMVELKVPTADGNYSQFTPSAGSNYENVDDVPPDSDTTYNSGDVGAIDTFNKADIANPSATIDAVVCTIYARSNDGGSAQVAAVVRSGGADTVGSGIAVPSSYDFLSSIVYVDPDTDAPFTAAGINAAEFGYKRTA